MCTWEKGHSYEYGLSPAAAGICSRTRPEPSAASKCRLSAAYRAVARDNARAELGRSAAIAGVAAVAVRAARPEPIITRREGRRDMGPPKVRVMETLSLTQEAVNASDSTVSSLPQDLGPDH